MEMESELSVEYLKPIDFMLSSTCAVVEKPCVLDAHINDFSEILLTGRESYLERRSCFTFSGFGSSGCSGSS